MYLLLTAIAVVTLNIWHRRWLKRLDAQTRRKHCEEIDTEAQHWQI